MEYDHFAIKPVHFVLQHMLPLHNLLSANKVLIEFPGTLLIIIKWISSHKQLRVNDNFIINTKLTKITQKFNSMRCIKNIQDGIFLEIY